MNEEKLMKKQLLENMLYNLIAFTIIFTIFGAMIYSQVKFSVYSNVERELLGYGNTEINIRKRSIIGIGQEKVILEKTEPERSLTIQNLDPFFTTQVGQLIGNPKIIYLLRDKEGNVINRYKYW